MGIFERYLSVWVGLCILLGGVLEEAPKLRNDYVVIT